MHFSKLAVAAAAAGVVSAQNTTMQSICDKYTTALLKNNTAANQYTVLTLLVKTVALGSFTGPGTQNAMLPGSMVKVSGILAPGNVGGTDVNLAPYFTGELASTNVNNVATSVNWLDAPTDMLTGNATYVGEPGSMTYMLLTHLSQYFGAALGCSHYGEMGFPPYGGDNSQYNVHKFMDLNTAEVTYFIQQVGAAAQSFGVSTDDATTVGNLLNNTFNYRCSPPATVIPAGGNQTQSICIAEDCAPAPNADCGIYDAAPEPSTVSSLIPSSTAMSSSGSMMSSTAMMSSATSAPVGGAQTPSGSATPSSSMTGGAAIATGVPAAIAGAAGLVALLL